MKGTPCRSSWKEGRCRAVIEEEAALSEHLQHEECRLFSMSVSHDNQSNVI